MTQPLIDYIVYSGSAIRRERRAKDLSLEIFSQLIGVSIGQASNFETGKRFPKADELQRMKEVFQKPIVVM